MSELTQEQFDELPDFAKDAFTQNGDVYIPAKDAKLKSTLDELDGKYKEALKNSESFESRLAEIEKAKQEEIEAAQLEAFEKAKKEGNVDAVEERWQQKLSDAEKRKNDELTALQAKLDDLANRIKTEKRNAIVSDLASEIAVPKGSKAFKLLVANRIDVDPSTGELTFLDENGSATSLDLDGFKGELEKDELFAPLLKSGIVTSGGGNANGSGGSAGQNRKFNEFSAQELVNMRRSDPAKYDRLKTEFHGN